MFRLPFLIASLLLAYFHSNIHAQSSFSLDQDTVTIIDGFFLDQSPPLERYVTVQITNDSQEDIEMKIDIAESYNSHPSDLDFLASAGPGTWYLEEPEAILTIESGASEYILFEVRAVSFDCIPKEFKLELSLYDISQPDIKKSLVFRGGIGDVTPATGYVLDGSNASESFTPHINDWDNNVEINNNGNGFQTYTIKNPHDSEIKIGWEVISFDHPIEWEVQNLLSITGTSGHKPIPFAFETTGAFWAWANGNYTFDDFFARIKHNRVPGSAVMRIKIYDTNDSLNYNDIIELSYHVCHPEAASEDVVNDSSSAVLCPGESLELSADSKYTEVVWSSGQVGQSITTMVEGNISLTAKNDKGCTVVDTIELAVIRPYDEDICLVNVDPFTFKNSVIWNSTAGVNTESYNLYKQTEQADSFELIYTEDFVGAHFYTDLSSDARVGSERYRVSTVDICNNESVGSIEHKTLHLTSNRGINGEINLIWEKYEGLDYSTFRILKGSSIDNMFLIAERPSNTFTFTDLNPNQADNFYRIEIDVDIQCLGQLASPSPPGSNVIHYQLLSDVQNENDSRVIVNPNPTYDFINIINLEGVNSIEIYNTFGQLIRQKNITSYAEEIDLTDLSFGQYYLKFYGERSFYRSIIKM